MATEAAVDRAVDAPASESQLVSLPLASSALSPRPSPLASPLHGYALLGASPPDAQNVDHYRSSVNGTPGIEDIENKHITSVDDQVHSTDVSTSGGSDTEASRADGSKSKDDDKGHGRTASSVKKPATFKSVSVNRTFLAAKAANASSTSATGTDKPPAGSSTPPTGSATLTVSRPRLVAKTGSARDSSPRFSSAANGGKPGSAPDPAVVWNKNRPPPVQEPKKLTDEELKKYGIHMASRLEEEDAPGQNKWADIDDDDDDWAPDAITWGDGTKTTLPHPDEHPDEHPGAHPGARPGAIPGAVPVYVHAHGIGHAHLHAAHAQAQALTAHAQAHAHVPAPGSDNGSVGSRGKTLEKPKSPAPQAPSASVGSPLAKSSGLASGKGLILKSGSQDKPTLVAKTPAPPAPVKSPWASLPPVEKASPATELAQLARPPTKGMTPPPKEIAADDFNRSSWKEGSHGNRELFNSHSGRYEPVPDRRGSMRMEQHPRHPALLQRPPSDHPAEPSGAFQTNRVSQEVPFGRRRGSSNVSGGSGSFMRMGKGNEGPMHPPEHLGPRRPSFAGSVESPVSPSTLSISAHGPPRQSGWMPRASPRAVFATPHQAGPPPEAVMGPPPPVLPVVDELEYQKKLMRERNELARKRRQEEEAREEAERRERIQKKLEALGPPPEKKAEKKETAARQEDSQPKHIQQRETSAPSAEGSTQPLRDGSKVDAPAQEEVTSPGTKATSPTNTTAPAPRRVSHGQEPRPTGLWAAAPVSASASSSAPRQERFSSWSSGSQPSSRNVWGSPNNDRGLGNGTFYTDLGRLPVDGNAPAQGNKGPSPIAPPSAARPPSSQGRPQPPAPIGSRAPRYGAAGSELASKWVASVSDNDKKLSAARLAERAERERQLAERGLSIEDAQPAIKDTWRPVHAPGDGTRRPVAAPDAQTHRPGPWRASGEDAVINPPHRGGHPAGTHDGIAGAGGSNASVTPQDEISSSRNAGSSGNGGTNASALPGGKGTGPQGRSSRFFPTKDIRLENAAPVDARSKSPTPPPPTMEGHPVYEGDVMRPHVSLPKPQPIVKLPPTMTASQPSQSRPQFGWANPPPFKDPRAPLSPNRIPLSAGEATQEKWQSRINSLLNGAKSPPLKSIGVDPASKSALDHATQPDSATVSLPRAPLNAPPVSTQRSSITKPMAEECFEEQEMGSLPQIRLPHKAPEAAWQPALAPGKPLPKKFLIQPAIMEPYYFPAEVVGGGNAMRIQFPGMTEPKIVTVPFSATRGGRGSSNTRAGPRHRGSGIDRRGGKRDASTSRPEHSAPSTSRGSRGSYRSRGSENWTRASATPPSLST
ncbi:hypothetical protein AK830_g6252 [Neonectria ditissima]|uniref:Uncharacterized protein n=1 Tax=Neonectria ditissima TaxID=78410 RepID=A0A0P7BCV3_9HYPO|nr:hypothetical protein AK830_g6252 [Neonectria ditissima]